MCKVNIVRNVTFKNLCPHSNALRLEARVNPMRVGMRFNLHLQNHAAPIVVLLQSRDKMNPSIYDKTFDISYCQLKTVIHRNGATIVNSLHDKL